MSVLGLFLTNIYFNVWSKEIDGKMIKYGDDIKLGSRVNMMDDKVTTMSENWNSEQSYPHEL